MKESVTGLLFIVSFIICGCGIESAFKDEKSFAVWAISLLVLIASAKVLGGGSDD